jgi:hypothetical protein
MSTKNWQCGYKKIKINYSRDSYPPLASNIVKDGTAKEAGVEASYNQPLF